MQEMEFWINSIVVTPRITAAALELQLSRAISCLDIYLEAEDASGTEFPKDKTFLKARRGRARSLPYKIIENNGNTVYTQI